VCHTLTIKKTLKLTLRSPFSTKNIQECHCGTESCRGVLGPKLKKPVYEERSLAASIIAGTKRKLQEVFSSSKGSESASSSPKKRKMGTSAMTKAMNAMAETQAAREKAKQDAAAVAAQLASREDRALKRNQAEALSKKSALRKTLHPPVSTIKSTRHATFSVRKVSKPGALKPVKRATQPLRPTALSTRGKKGLRPNRAPEVRATPEDSDSPVSSSEDESPNITPASLRSATKKLVQTKQLAQSKLNFKPLRFDAKQRSSLRRSKSVQEVPDSEEEDEDVEEEEDEDVRKAYVASNAKGKKRGNAPAPRSIHTTGAGVLKSLGGRTRGAQGTFLKKR
jgi:palmitoyltransferase ZDHHC9/14/18